jgi:glutamate/tyrosine decarboxylase-like PLP-dependent enzyme
MKPISEIWNDEQLGLLADASSRASRYLRDQDARSVAPSREAVAGLERLQRKLGEDGRSAASVLDELDTFGSPATTVTTGGRYFGFVNGGTLPATLAANWLAAAWDQNAALRIMSPVGAALEDIALGWLVDVLGLPAGTGGGLVTCATMASFACLAAARHAMLARQGWDVERQGLFGAPEITVVVGDEVHAAVSKALAMLGFGRGRVMRVPTDGQGRMRADRLPELDAQTIVCLQAGNVNSGAFDPAGPVVEAAHAAGAWVHVDGAFGLWAAAAPGRAHLVSGYARADSWAVDGHKWLNVPYDSGIALVREPAHLRAAMSVAGAAYLTHGSEREPMDYTPDNSRRSRGIELWAALSSLGRSGVADLVERCCRHAARFGAGLREAGYDVLNDVQLNQVLVSFGDEETTRKIISEVQADGTCWCGGTVWHGQNAMRISVSCWATTEEDVEESLRAILRIAGEARGRRQRRA